MGKKKTKKILPIIAISSILILLIVGVFFGVMQSVLVEDFIPYGENRGISCTMDDQREDLDGDPDRIECTQLPTDTWDVAQVKGSGGFISGSEDDIRLQQWCGGIRDPFGSGSLICRSASIRTSQDMTGKTVRANLAFESQIFEPLGADKSCYSVGVGSSGVLSRCINRGAEDGGLIEFIPNILNRENFDVTYQGVIVAENVPSGDGKITFASSAYPNGFLSVQNFRWKPLFNCEVETDEVAVVREFASGTTFSIEDLDPAPVKFCLDSFPAVVRSFEDEGVATDVKGSITRSLASGESITVNEGETIRISYIADFEEGIQQCEPGDVWNVNTNQCEDLIQVEADEPNIISRVDVIIPGDNQVVIRSSGALGDGFLSVLDVDYKCYVSYPQQNYEAPNPEPGCWVSDISTPHEQYSKALYGANLKPNQYYSIDNLITAKWDSDLDNCGNFRFDDEDPADPSDAFGCVMGKGDLLFTWEDYSAIDARNVDDQEFATSLNAPKNMLLRVNNNWGVSFTSNQAGVQVTETRDLIFGTKRYDVPHAFVQGSNEITLPVDTSVLGEVKYEIIPYIKVGGAVTGDNAERLLDDQKVTYTFFVEGSGVEVPVSDQIITGARGIPVGVLVGVVAGFVFLIALILFAMRKRK